MKRFYVTSFRNYHYVSNNSIRGDAGKGINLEAVKIKLSNALPGMRIKYQAHVQNIGWQNWVYDDAVAGTEEQNLRMEAIRIQLEGAPKGYRVEYQVYIQDIGWMNPVYDGDMAGTMGLSKRIEAIKINVVKVRYQYSYDAAGNLASQEDYKYVYDSANRPAKITDNKGSVVTYGYDLNNNINSLI